MQTGPVVWTLTILAVAGLLLVDYVLHVRKTHSPSLREAAIWSSAYIGIAVLFGIGLTVIGGGAIGGQYFAGYITEKALSVDNVFVFLIINASFKVPRANQQKALLFGITISLIARIGFILLGVALINSFAWIFYIFGFVLFITAANLLKPKRDTGHDENNASVRLTKRLFRTHSTYDGDKLFTTVDGRRVLTPMLLAMVAIGITDVVFALDSIPAIFGLTQNLYVVVTATAFSLLGLRQLYFLIDGLLDRLVYLSYGLAAILGFIGVKLVLHALHENTLPWINHGRPIAIAEIDTSLSLAVIIGVLAVTVGASLARARRSSPSPRVRRDAATPSAPGKRTDRSRS